MVGRDYLVENFSHYFDRLAFECGLVGADRGRVVIYYEAIPGEKFMVYERALVVLKGGTVVKNGR